MMATRSKLKKSFFLVILVSVCGIASGSFAITLPCNKNQLAAYRNLIQKTAIIGGEDRMTVPKYAEKKGLSVDSVQKMFSATGTLKCNGGFEGTAQLTNNLSVITTARHILFDDKCRRRKIKWCRLYLYKNGGSRDNPIAVDLSSLIAGPCSAAAPRASDWVVAKLSRPAPGNYRPYQMPDAPPEFNLSTQLTQVAGETENFVVGGKMPQNVAECSPVGKNSAERIVLTSCDTGGGTSGAALLLNANSYPTIAAIHSTSMKSGQENGVVPVDQEMIDAVKALSGQ